MTLHAIRLLLAAVVGRFRVDTMRALRLLVLGLFVFWVVFPAQAQVLTIQADYVTTETTRTGDVRIAEYGRHYLSNDGRSRVERFRDDGHTSRIVFSGDGNDDDGIGERIDLNHRTRSATRRIAGYWWPPGESRSDTAAPSQDGNDVFELPEHVDWVEGRMIEGRPIAERAIGPLVLRGFRFVGDLAPNLSFELEEWYAVNAPTTHLIERRNVMSDGTVNETRVIAVAQTTVPESMFAVPEGYRVLDLVRPRNGPSGSERVRP